MEANFTPTELLNMAHARALFYDFFYGVLTFEELPKRKELLGEQLRLLQNTNVNPSVFGEPLEFLNTKGIEGIKEEHSRLFSFPFGGKQVGLYLSHFYQGFLSGEALLEAKTLLKKTKMRLNHEGFRESEEHLGFWCGFMCYLINQEIEQQSYLIPKEYKEEDLQEGNVAFSQEVFTLGSGALFGMCEEISNHPHAVFYKKVVDALEDFLSFEENYYSLSKIPYKRRELAKQQENYDHKKNYKRSKKERTATATPMEELLIRSSNIDPNLLRE